MSTQFAGTLSAKNIALGVTTQEIVNIALANLGDAWTADGCAAFVWGVTNLAGLPFFDLENKTANNDPTSPQDTDYIVPHSTGIKSGTADVPGDGWYLASSSSSVSDLTSTLQPGDVVRVYKAGNTNEDSADASGQAIAHSFIVVSNASGNVQVVDNWTGVISEHSLSDITNSWAPGGQFAAAFVSRIDSPWVANNVPHNTLVGDAYGDWSMASLATTSVIYSEDFNNSVFQGVNIGAFGTSDKYAVTNYYTINNFDGWTFSGNTYYALNGAGTDGAVTLNEGPPGGAASTTVVGLIPGQTYSLSFNVWGDNEPGLPWVLNVSVDAVPLLTVTGVDQPPGTNPGMFETVSFVATGTSAHLDFSQASLSLASPIIDNVRVATPIVINNVTDLQAIQNDPSGYYVLGANIDAAGFGFTPIGSAANPFTGIFDGQGHTISNLTINNVSDTDSGLFGDIGATGTVRNVGLINESVTSSQSYVGGLVGENFGTISESYVSGNVSGINYVGALVGLNGPSGSITQSFATGTANGHLDVGGLVGINQGAITESYATGTTNPSGNAGVAIGGLAGLNSGSIAQSYATGLVGVGGGFALGGLVGSEALGTVTASYWDTQTTGRSTSADGTGLTTAQLQSGMLPAGFDPTIWSDIAGQFPELRWQVSTSYTFKTIDLGTSTAAYDINNVGQIVGYYTDTKVHAFIYNISDATYIAINAPGGVNGTDGDGINDLGQIVGQYANGFTDLGYLYSGGTYTTLFDPSAVFGTFAQGINDTGQVVGFYGDSNAVQHGFLYTGGAYTTLDDPLATNGTQARDINNAAQIVGTYTDGSGTHGFLYSGGTYTTLDDPLAAPGQTFATGINDVGQIAGYYYDLSGVAHGFLDIGGNFTTIDDNLATGGTFAQDINNAGQIVGYYSDGSGTHAFLATAAKQPPPSILAITAFTDNGLTELNTGHVVTITAKMSAVVSITGVPTFQLNDNEVASYISGSGTDTLTFAYTVKQGDTTSDLQVTGLNLPNGATVQDGTGQNVTGRVAQDLTLQIDTTNPIVTAVSASPSSGDLNAGHVVTITLGLSGPVKVKGVPTLSLNDGGTANYKAAASNPAAGILVFNYTIKATENAHNLGITNVNTDSVAASVKDTTGHVADFTNALTTFNGLQVDTAAPTIASIVASGAGIDNGVGHLGLGSIVTLTVNFSESVNVATTGGIPTLNLNDGGKAIYAGGSGTNALNFTYSVAAKQTTPDLMVNGLALNGGTIIDGAGNNAVLSGAKINPVGILQIDGNVPVVKEHLTNDTGISHSDSITANAAIAGTGDPNTIIQLIIDGTANAATVVVDSLGQWFFTPAFADGLHTVGATEIDAAGNTGATSLTLTQDTKPPTVVSVTDDANSGGLSIGDTLSIKVQFSEAVNVAGNPILTLNDGGKATYDAVKSFPLFGQSVFDYTVSAHEDTANLQVVKLAGGSIKDIAGNSADLSGATSVSLGIATGANSLPPSNSLATDITLAENKIYSQVADQFPFDTHAAQAEHLTDLKFVLPILKDLDPSQGFSFSDQFKGYIYETGSNQYDTGQCVSLVLAIDHYLPQPTSKWGEGGIAVDLNGTANPAMLPGTPIATFGTDGHYNSDHAGIFLGPGSETWKGGKTVDGFFMLDQNIAGTAEPAEIRFHPFNPTNPTDPALEYHNIIAFSDFHLV